MKHKEFLAWCNERACDGRWGYDCARLCCAVAEDITKAPFWQRERIWRTLNKILDIEGLYVEPTNVKIKEFLGGQDD